MNIDKKIIIPSILVLISGVLVVTLAYFGTQIINEGIVNSTGVTTGKLNVTLSDTVVNVNGLAPIYEDTVDSLAYKKNFTISTDADSLKSCNKVFLNIDNMSSALSSSYFKYKLVANGNNYSGTFAGRADGDKIQLINNIYMENGQSKVMTLYLWISYDNNVDQMNMLGTEFNANLLVEGRNVKNASECSGM